MYDGSAGDNDGDGRVVLFWNWAIQFSFCTDDWVTTYSKDSVCYPRPWSEESDIIVNILFIYTLYKV